MPSAYLVLRQALASVHAIVMLFCLLLLLWL